jgi:2-polyprenyl-3-methyl-5-hydroxy-6-metoxy-1,4-benzoquinol methylase
MTEQTAFVDPHYAYAEYADRPDPDHRGLYLSQVQRVLRELPSGAAVLDAGCGGGLFSIGLHEAGFAVCGLDLSESGIAAAQARNIGTFKLASAYDDLAAPFSRSDFDAIVAIEVIEHLYSPAKFASRLFEAAKPGAPVIITTPYWGYFKNLALALTNRTDRSLTALWEGGHIKHFSRRTLTTLMERHGFETVSFIGTGEGWRAKVPGLWSGMMMVFRKPL